MRFTIFTHVLHTEEAEEYSAYSPYVREMNLWLRHVEEVEVVAPKISEREFGDQISYIHNSFIFTRIPSFHFLNIYSSFNAIIKIPVILLRIVAAMKRSDHLHLRCPGNIGLLACICQVFFPKKLKSAKYAGNWDPRSSQPWSYRFQKWILSNRFLTRNLQVLVYGEWPHQTKNIQPFFTASFSEEEIAFAKEKNFDDRIIFLFVGNLVRGKHPLYAVQLVQELQTQLKLWKESLEMYLYIYGDGPERKMLEAYCKDQQLERLVKFEGSRTLEELKKAYQEAQFVILPSQSEGWPKAVAEGMFFGCIPIATEVSCVPWMLGGGSRGILMPALEIGTEIREKRGGNELGGGHRAQDSKQILSETVVRLIDLIQSPEEMKRMSLEAQAWSQEYNLERFEEAIKKIIYNNIDDINFN